MTPTQAINFLQALGCKPSYDGGIWVKADCALAPFTHKNHKDTNPSFGISCTEGEHSHFNCFTCNSGSVEELVGQLELYVSQNPTHAWRYNFKAARELLAAEELVTTLPEFTEFGNAKQQEFQEWPQYFIDNFPSVTYSKDASQYLDKRGVTLHQRALHNLRWDVHKSMVVCPYHNAYGKLAGARGRSVLDNVSGWKKHFDYTWNQVNNASLTWYNEPCLQHEEIVVVVEGQFDLYRVERVYPHVLANLTAKPVPHKIKKLQQVPGVILMLDNDPTADKAIELYLNYFDRYDIKCAVIQPPKELDADGKLIKQDPDSMGESWIAEQLKDLVNI
jgi:hypothetical protein